METAREGKGTVLEGGALLRIRQVCEELSIGRSLVYEMINDGRLRAVRVGKRSTRIPRAEVARFLNELREVRGGF